MIDLENNAGTALDDEAGEFLADGSLTVTREAFWEAKLMRTVSGEPVALNPLTDCYLGRNDDEPRH